MSERRRKSRVIMGASEKGSELCPGPTTPATAGRNDFTAGRPDHPRGTMTQANVQHHLNGLHVLARLRDLGLPSTVARPLARAWERLVHPLIYRRKHV